MIDKHMKSASKPSFGLLACLRGSEMSKAKFYSQICQIKDLIHKSDLTDKAACDKLEKQLQEIIECLEEKNK